MDKEAAGGYPQAPGAFNLRAGDGFPGGTYGAAGYAYADGYGASEDYSPLPSASGVPQRPSNFHSMSLGLLVLLPAITFVLLVCAGSMEYHQVPSLCWTLDALCICISTMFMVVKPTRDGPRYWFNLGSLCLIATILANVAGVWNYRRHFGMYWAYEGQRDYSNVSPTDPALGHLDGGRLLFSVDAKVDVAASIGYTLDGERYCVAPIVGDVPSPEVEYWAAGVNCCSERGYFDCDDATNRQARSGLVFLDYGPRREDLAKFREAARKAGVERGAQPSPDALFVSWVVDPLQAQLWYWHAGVAFLAGSSSIYLGVSLVAGICLHFGRRAPAASAVLAKGKV